MTRLIDIKEIGEIYLAVIEGTQRE
jgi:hypothetical protein